MVKLLAVTHKAELCVPNRDGQKVLTAINEKLKAPEAMQEAKEARVDWTEMKDIVSQVVSNGYTQLRQFLNIDAESVQQMPDQSESVPFAASETSEFACPVCYEPYQREPKERRPFTICTEGHVVCYECKSQIENQERIEDQKCPMDRMRLLSPPVENRLLLDVLEAKERKVRTIPQEELQIENPIIGSGGFAVIRKGKWLRTVVAIKQSYHQGMENLKKEAAMLNELNHPNIARLYGLVNTNDMFALVMEFVEHGSLYELMKTNLLNFKEKVGVCLDVVSALTYLHSKGVIHRDLKPANILVSLNTSDRSRTYKGILTDFGISKDVAKTNQCTTDMGTPKYTAPELLDKGQPYNRSADIYSMGTIMYELFSGEELFQGHSHWQILIKIDKNDFPNVPETIPEPIRDLIPKCWKRNIYQRPSLEDIHEALCRLDATEANCNTDSSPVGMQEQATKCRQVTAVIPAVSTTGFQWTVDESDYCKTLREKMVSDLREKSNFRHWFDPSVLEAAGRIPRHAFIDKNRSSTSSELRQWTEEPDDMKNLQLISTEDRESLLIAYQYSCPMPATEWANESCPEVLLAQLSLVNVEPENTVVLIGAKGGYTQAIVSHIVGLHGVVYTISGNNEALEKCKERCKEICPSPLWENMRWRTVSDIRNWEEVVRVVKDDNEISNADVVIVCGSVAGLPNQVLSMLTRNGRVLAPVDNGNAQVLQVMEKASGSTKNITDFPINFGEVV